MRTKRLLWLFHECQKKEKKNPWRLNEWKSLREKKKSTTAVTVDGNVGRRTAERPCGFWNYGNKDGLVPGNDVWTWSHSSLCGPPASQPSILKMKMRDSGPAEREEAVAWGWTPPSDGQMFAWVQIHLEPRPRLLSLQSDQLYVNRSHCHFPKEIKSHQIGRSSSR